MLDYNTPKNLSKQLPLRTRLNYLESLRRHCKNVSPNLYRQKIMFQEKLNTEIPKHSLILSGFNWQESKEGLDYWREIDRQWQLKNR